MRKLFKCTMPFSFQNKNSKQTSRQTRKWGKNSLFCSNVEQLAISTKNEFLSQYNPYMNPSPKMGKIFLKEPKYVERDCVTALKIILIHFQQWIKNNILNGSYLVGHSLWNVACEQQTHFRSSLLSLQIKIAIFRRERGDDRKCVCCWQAMWNVMLAKKKF